MSPLQNDFLFAVVSATAVMGVAVMIIAFPKIPKLVLAILAAISMVWGIGFYATLAIKRQRAATGERITIPQVFFDADCGTTILTMGTLTTGMFVVEKACRVTVKLPRIPPHKDGFEHWECLAEDRLNLDTIPFTTDASGKLLLLNILPKNASHWVEFGCEQGLSLAQGGSGG